MLVSFKGDEEKLIDSVISVLDGGREKFTFQEMNIISELQHKGIIINLERREVIRNGKKVGMTYTEFEILQLLAKNPGRVLSNKNYHFVDTLAIIQDVAFKLEEVPAPKLHWWNKFGIWLSTLWRK